MESQHCYQISKKWDPSFLIRGGFNDCSLSEDLTKFSNGTRDSLGFFLRNIDNSFPDNLEEVEEFCGGADLRDIRSGHGLANQKSAAWLDHRSHNKGTYSDTKPRHSGWMTPSELYHYLAAEVSHRSLELCSESVMRWLNYIANWQSRNAKWR